MLLESKGMDQWYIYKCKLSYVEMQEGLKTMDKHMYYESNKTSCLEQTITKSDILKRKAKSIALN